MRRRPLHLLAAATALVGAVAAAPAASLDQRPLDLERDEETRRPSVCVKYSPLDIDKTCLELGVLPTLPFPSPLP